MRHGVGDAGGPLGIVGQQQEPFAGFVEAAYRGQPAIFLEQGGGKQVVDGLPAFFVGGGGDDAARFVQHQVKLLGSPDGLAVDFDVIAVEMDRGLGIATDRGVPFYLAGANEFDGVGAGAEAEFRESAGEAGAGDSFR